MHELSMIVTALSHYRPRRNPLRNRLKRAAVAVVLRETRQGTVVLLVERAHRPGDPWSGDMALPGGRVDAVDETSASRAACRETGEEIGLSIGRDNGLGRLSDRLTLDHRRRAPMVVSPFVYRCSPHAVLQNNHEIAHWQWCALAWLDEPMHRYTFDWHVGRLRLTMPSYACGCQRRLWGLTLSILDELRHAIHRHGA